MDAIRIRGARQHNLRNVDIDIPRGKLVVVTGLSGSGKSSLAFHTLYAEGQRRYVESLSAYARQFLDQLDKPEVDAIEGLSPAIAIEQRGTGANPRSIIATATEIHDYLRILYAAIGVPHDPETGERLERMIPADVVASLKKRPEGTKVMLLAPLDPEAAADMPALLRDLQRQGFVRLRVNGELVEVEEVEARFPAGKESRVKKLEVVVDRLLIRPGVESRLADSVETVLRICSAEAVALLQFPGNEEWEERSFLTSYRNPRTGFEVPELSPRHFSFNSHEGACETCHGLGTEQFCDPLLLVPDSSRSIKDGAIRLSRGGGRSRSWHRNRVVALAGYFGVSEEMPFGALPDDFKNALFYGTDGAQLSMARKRREGPGPGDFLFEGICREVERLYHETGSESLKRNMARFMASRSCQACRGRRLKREFLSVKVEGTSGKEGLGIDELCALPIEEGMTWMEGVEIPGDREEAVGPVVEEVCRRLRFLKEVGLGYLALDRGAATLSGGEFQRIRLATQLGAGLSGVLYVLDEPSIGLHPEDNARLIRALESLRDLGNTIVVVEHDEEMTRSADHLIELGPGAGLHGGHLVAEGTIEDIMEVDCSPTGRWLRGRDSCTLPRSSLAVPGEERKLVIRGAREHNLRNLEVEIPLGQLVAVTGRSGSGKSTLVDKILKRALARHFHGAKAVPGEHDVIEGLEHVGRLVVVDQSPLGRSPRSNPATYTGAFDHIRKLFAQLPLSRQRGYAAGRFSFNMKGGRCEKCQGGGAIRIDMHFLNDVYVTCDACGGRRYNRETLEVTYKGRSIADVLDLTAEEGAVFFGKVPKLNSLLEALCEVGLGYIRLGQSANTLSGGEAQRIKLAAELAKTSGEGVLYLLDEPTTGLHHHDVQVLLGALMRLREAGHSLVVIEHNLEIIAASDWVIDLGPGGGRHGGEVVAVGRPADLEEEEGSLTGKWLARSARGVENTEVFG
ncbi:MAG: excinuclease ABC subunit UvrA [Verrucomicrobiota bacterium]|nr:excinuclease ABC subunit UvrA [Verrucomicrobiota bacterium]